MNAILLCMLLAIHPASSSASEKPDPIRIKGDKYFYPYDCESGEQKAKLQFYNRKADWEFNNINGLFDKHSKPDECIDKVDKGKYFSYFLSVADGETLLLQVEASAREGVDAINVRQLSARSGACTKQFEFKCKLDKALLKKHSKT